MIAPLSSRPISAGRAPPPCARQIRTVGSARERAAGDQRRRGHCRLDGHPGAEAQSQPGHPGRQVLVTGMDQDQRAEFMRDGEEPVQARVGQLDTADLRTDLDTEESRWRMHRRISSTARSGSCRATAPSAAKRVGCCAHDPRRRTRFEPTPVRPRRPQTPGSRTSPESAKALARQRLHGPYRRVGHQLTNTGDRSGGREPHRTSGSASVSLVRSTLGQRSCG